MGKRFIIIDNRPDRAQRLMGDKWQELISQTNLIYVNSIPVEEELFSYDVIGIHGSYLKENHLEDLFSSLVKDKYVVFFTGDVSQAQFFESGHLLKIPAVVFYSQHLIPFCSYLASHTESDIPLSALVYGVDHWRIPQLLKLRHLLWQYPVEERRFKQNKAINELMTVLSIQDTKELDERINAELKAL